MKIPAFCSLPVEKFSSEVCFCTGTYAHLLADLLLVSQTSATATVCGAEAGSSVAACYI